jgi:hypothetical protein
VREFKYEPSVPHGERNALWVIYVVDEVCGTIYAPDELGASVADGHRAAFAELRHGIERLAAAARRRHDEPRVASHSAELHRLAIVE